MTTDQRLQDARRSAALGVDPGAEARLIVERMRAGTLDVERVRLAAYCGHEAARAVISKDGKDGRGWLADWSIHVDRAPFAGWVQGLSRWGREACVRAAVAASRAAYQVDEPCSWVGCEGGECAHCEAIWASLDAAEEWLADPTPEKAAAWVASWVDATGPGADPAWVPCAEASRRDGWANLCRIGVEAAAHKAGEQPVREAIQNALVAWALGEQP